MALLSELTALRARVAASPGRLEKRRLVADYLRGLTPEDLRLRRHLPERPRVPRFGPARAERAWPARAGAGPLTFGPLTFGPLTLPSPQRGEGGGDAG